MKGKKEEALLSPFDLIQSADYRDVGSLVL